MSIADHFQHAPDAGFVRNYGGDVARRQFRMSLILVAVIALAAAALTAVIRFDGPTVPQAAIVTLPTPPHFAGKL